MAAAQDSLDMSAIFSQQNRLMKIDTVLGPETVVPQRVVGLDRLSRAYDYTVDLLSLSDTIELKLLIAKPVTLWIQQLDAGYLPVHGYVHTAKKLGNDGQLIAYQLSFAPWLHFLKFRRDARIWQDKTPDVILAEVFNGHAQAQGNFRFELTQPLRSRSYCTQYETDWQFAMRLMEEEGWYSYHEQAEDGAGHMLVVTDSVHTLKPRQPEQVAFHHAGASDEIGKIMQWGGVRTLPHHRLATRTFDYKAPGNIKETDVQVLPTHGELPSQLESYEYTGAYTYGQQDLGERQSRVRVEEWESGAKRFHGTSGLRQLSAGNWFTLEARAGHEGDSVEERQFAVIAVQWAIENNLPLSSQLTDFPGSLKSQLDDFRLQASLPPANGDERTGHCFNRFEAQRRAVEYRSPPEHARPVMHPQTATVVGPAGEEIFTDALNRVKVRFHWDRINPGDEKASCWVRVSYPNAGQGWGAVHVPRIGQEVIITFLDADIDRPIITGRIYNGEQNPQWHTDGRLSGYKSKEYKGAGYNQLVMYDNTSQNRIQLYSSSANAQLNLGYLIGQQDNTRGNFHGTGFALHADAYGGIRANQGLYISTFTRPAAAGAQLEADEARDQLAAGHTLGKEMSDTAVKAGAEPLGGQDALQHFGEASREKYTGDGQQQANRFKDPILLMAAPAGIGATTPGSTHLHSGEHVTLSAGSEINMTTGKSLVASIKEKISLFAYNAGIKLFAAKGKVEIQAQSDDLDLIAEKVLRIISTTDRIEIWAKKEIVLGADGSAIVINGAGITDMTRGHRISHNSEFSLPGPKVMPYALPTLAKPVCLECLKKRAAQRTAFINKGTQ